MTSDFDVVLGIAHRFPTVFTVDIGKNDWVATVPTRRDRDRGWTSLEVSSKSEGGTRGPTPKNHHPLKTG